MRGKLGVVIVGVALLAACASEETRVLDPQKSAQINTDLGIAYMNQGDYNTALSRLQKAIEYDASYPYAYSSLGLLYARLGQTKEAEENFRTAVKLDSTNPDIRNNYGAFLCKEKRLAQAEEQFMTAVKNPLYRTPEVSYVNAGLCAGDAAKAEQHFRTALKQNPQFPAALYQMASLSFEQERFLSARAYLQRLHAVAEPSPQSLWLSVRVETRLGDTITVRSHSEQLKTRFPDAVETGQLLEMERK